MQGRHLHNEKYPYDWVSAPRPTPPDASWDHAGDTTHFGRNECKKKDYGKTAQSLINHRSMNLGQFKDHVSHMCLAGAVVASWSLAPEVAGSSPFTIMTSIFVSEFVEFSENI